MSIVKYESKHSVCIKCNKQIGLGNKFLWASFDPKSKTGTMQHDYNCKDQGTEYETNAMKANCSVCGKTATKVNSAGLWACSEHLENKTQAQNISIPEIVKELKKYITVDDLEKITEVREKLRDLDIENIVDEFTEKKNSINETKGELDFLVEELTKTIEEQKKKIIPQTIEVKILDKEGITLTGKHKCYPKLLQYIANKKDTWVNGPAGSGKSTAIRQATLDLGMKFYAAQLSQLSLKSELTGYRDIMDKSGVMTDFWTAYKNGGVFFGSEFDNWAPTVVTSVNIALANGYYPFPTETIERHKDFVMIVDGNTIGLGAENHYVTSRAVSGASRDRFRFLEWPIDEDLEFVMVPKEYKYWVEFVQKCRALVTNNGNLLLITPRATIQGAEDLAMGFSRKEVVNNVLLRGQEAPSYLIAEIQKFVK